MEPEPGSNVLDISRLQEMFHIASKAMKRGCAGTNRVQGMEPNSSIMCSFFQAKMMKSCNKACRLDIFMDTLKDDEFLPLLDVCMAIPRSEVEAVDVHNGPSCTLSGAHALSLIYCIEKKLQDVNLQNLSLGIDFLREISERGLGCRVLNLRSSFFRKLNMVGDFRHLQTLNLDYSATLSGFEENCFTSMPKLVSLSMCGTRVSNLWTTVAALTKLSSLEKLWFQEWVCCNDNAATIAPPAHQFNDQLDLGHPSSYRDARASFMDVGEITDLNFTTQETFSNSASLRDMDVSEDDEIMMDASSDGSEGGFSTELFSNVPLRSRQPRGKVYLSKYLAKHRSRDVEPTSNASAQPSVDLAMKYISHHASAICFKKHYREFMIASLPQLKVLDNLPVRNSDRESAGATYSKYFEYLPYKRRQKESVVSILYKRELKERRFLKLDNCTRPSSSRRVSQYSYTRSLSASKVGSSAWPLLCPLSISGCDLGDGVKRFRPSQFEYHPSVSSLMVFGTLEGEVVVINHENGKMVRYIPSVGAMSSVLGLCWLKKFPSKLIAGSDNGSLRLYDIEKMHAAGGGVDNSVSFYDFDQLTSVHANSTDELFLASGYSKDVALYDINSGRRIQVFTDMHREHINVVKFSNHSPSIFATSSFDQDVKLWDLRQQPLRPCYTTASSKGNVMVCFSPDDHYLLASAVDNEVRQMLAVDGRINLNFEIAPTGSSQNYTRSYYMNGRDYIVSGSCDEQVVHVCCAQTGRHLKDVALEDSGLGTTSYVQSLRGDPHRDFNMSILAAYLRPSSKSEIVKVNLLASRYDSEEQPWIESWTVQNCPSNRLGG